MGAIEVEDQTEADVRYRSCPGCGQILVITMSADARIMHPTPSCTWMTPDNAIPWLVWVFDPVRAQLPS